MLKLSFYSDNKAESDLRRMAVLYSIVSIPFSKIDLKESQVNGARLNDAIRHHKVEDYMQGFRNGDTFPRIVVHKTPTGYVILSGNQRSEAIRRLIAAGELPKNVEMEVYLVETKDKLLLEIIARSANANHGEGDTKEERIQQAMYCVRTLGMAVKDAAKCFTVSAGAIHDNIRAEEVRSTLQKSGIDAHRVANAALEPLSKLDFDTSAQVKLGSLAVLHSPTAERIKQVAAKVKKQGTTQARAAIVKEFERELTEQAHAANAYGRKNGREFAGTKVPQRPRRDKLVRMLTSLANFLDSGNEDGEPFARFDQLQITTKVDRELVTDLAKRIRYRLGVITR